MRPATPVPRGLARLRWLARAAILFERIWPALWPPLGVAGLFLGAALLDLPWLLPPWPHLLLLGAAALLIVALLVRGLMRVRAPDRAAADRRLERHSGVAHRPLAALADHSALPGTEALWQAHLARAAREIRRLRVGLPRPGLAMRDRRALRGGLLVALFAAAVVAGGDAPLRLKHAFAPGFPPMPAAPAPLLQAWVTPPAYTGLAPIFLHLPGGAVSVPAGSHLTVSLTGTAAQPSLTLDGRAIQVRTLDAASFQAETDLTAGGRLLVRRGAQPMANWDLSVIADEPPTAVFTAPPGQAPRGLAVRLPWLTSDDYGVVSLQAELRLKDRPEAPPLTVTIPLPGNPKNAHGVAVQDLTAHPWAGLPVTARLVARDAPGQQGISDEAEFDLPERSFSNPLARQLIELRKLLSINPAERMTVVGVLDELSNVPALFGGDLGGFLNLRAVASLLFHAPGPEAVPEAQARMWQLALELEEGATGRAARALEEARKRLDDALARDAAGQHVDAKELDKLMQEFRRALDEHMQALAEQLKREQAAPDDAQAQRIDPAEMDRQAQAMQDSAKAGQMDQAREKLQQLERMLQALRDAKPGQQHDREQAARQQGGRQQMGAVQDLVRRQGGLLDHLQQRDGTHDADPLSMRQPGALPYSPQLRSPAEPQPVPSPEQDAARQADQRVQQALRRALGELMQRFGDLAGQVPPSLGQAEGAMRDAAQALGKGDDEAAGAAEKRAVEALQQGGRDMARQMASMMGRQQGEKDDQDQQGESENGDPSGQAGTMSRDGHGGQPMPGGERQGHRQDPHRDPFGRLTKEGTSGSDEASDVEVPEQMEQARSRAIEQELRRRGAERNRPQQELDYIDRLLKQF